MLEMKGFLFTSFKLRSRAPLWSTCLTISAKWSSGLSWNLWGCSHLGFKFPSCPSFLWGPSDSNPCMCLFAFWSSFIDPSIARPRHLCLLNIQINHAPCPNMSVPKWSWSLGTNLLMCQGVGSSLFRSISSCIRTAFLPSVLILLLWLFFIVSFSKRIHLASYIVIVHFSSSISSLVT